MITQKAWYLWASSTVLCHLRLRVVMCQLLILQPVLVTYSRYSSSLRWSRTRSSFSRSFRTWSSLLMHSTQFAELVLMTPTSRSQSLPLKQRDKAPTSWGLSRDSIDDESNESNATIASAAMHRHLIGWWLGLIARWMQVLLVTFLVLRTQRSVDINIVS